jgi:pyrimidine deaminase RibD-like protein
VDPNPLVDGGGVSLLRAAGIEVVAIDGAEAEEAAGLNPEFMKRMREGAKIVAAAAAAAAARKK